MRLTSAPSGPPFVGAPGDALVCQGGDQWAAGPSGGAKPAAVLILSGPPFALNPGGQLPLGGIFFQSDAGAVTPDGWQFPAGALGLKLYEVIWSGAATVGGWEMELAQDPLGLDSVIAGNTLGDTGGTCSAVIQINPEAPASERTIQFRAGGPAGTLDRVSILIRQIN